jgi:hypothetical protein
MTITHDAPEWAQTTEKVEAHYSSISLHRKCPQAWYYRYDLGLTRPQQLSAPERDFGSWWGLLRAAESLERGRRYGSLLGGPRKIRGFKDASGVETRWDQKTMTVREVLAAADDWWEDQRDEMLRAEWADRLGCTDLAVKLASHMQRWHDTYALERAKERPLGVELFWKRELPRPQGDAEWDAMAASRPMPKMVLLGYIDELYFDDERQMVVARDHKSAKALPTQSAFNDMQDSQLQFYAWGITPTLASWGAPKVRAVAYDRMCSIAPKPPTLTQAGALAVRGGEPSIASTDLETYKAWAEGPDGEGVPWGEPDAYYVSGPRKGQPKFGRYTAEDKVIERLSAPQERARWFQRTLTPLNANLIRAHLRAAVDSTTDIWRTQERARLTLEAARNMTDANCRWCDFQSICRAQMFGGADGQYELAEHNLQGPNGLKVLGA